MAELSVEVLRNALIGGLTAGLAAFLVSRGQHETMTRALTLAAWFGMCAAGGLLLGAAFHLDGRLAIPFLILVVLLARWNQRRRGGAAGQ